MVSVMMLLKHFKKKSHLQYETRQKIRGEIDDIFTYTPYTLTQIISIPITHTYR